MGQPAYPRRFPLRFGAAIGVFVALRASLVCLFFVAGSVHALDPNKRVSQYIHTSWRIQDGSLPGTMFSIAQTSDGFLWFASQSQGLYRFDGVRFVPWPLVVDGETITTIVAVYGDHGGGLWALGRPDIVHLKDRVVDSHFELDGVQSVNKVVEDPDGSFWLVRSSNGVSDAPLCHLTESSVKCFGKSDGVPICPLDSLMADGKGGFWLGGQTALAHWQPDGSHLYPITALKSNAGQNGIMSLVRGPDATLWVGVFAEGAGLQQWKNGAVEPFVTATFDGSKLTVHDMIFDHDGNLWVGTLGKGLYRIHGAMVDHYGRTEGLSSDTVNNLFEDREGIVWAVTTNGIDSFRDPRVVTFSALEGLGKNSATGVLAARDGTIWVANAESLDHIAGGTVSSIRTGSGLPGHQVSSLLQDRLGNLWVGVDDGLYLFNSGRFRRLPEPNHKPLGLVVGMTEDIEGDIWAECAGNPRRLVRIHDFQIREEFSASQVPPGHTLAPDPHGGIWIGTLKGDLVLLRRHGALQKFFLHPKGNPVSHQIIASGDGAVLAASTDGLVGLRQGKVQTMTTANGLPCTSIISFIADAEKRWWLYTGCGVVELPDSELQKWWANPESVLKTRVYNLLDGAQPQAPSFNSAALTSDGRVWFATGVVIQMIDPSRVAQAASSADTYIESVLVDRKNAAVTDKISLPPHPRELQIDYTSPTLLIPQRVKFRYRLDPYDHDWHEAGTRRQAFYTDLPPGRYSFRVIAANSEGVWNDNGAHLDFSVAPAYYQTTWFRALCAMGFLAVLWTAYHWRIRQLRRQFEMTLDARVSERTRIARELHDTLLQSFHGLLLRFETVSQLLPDRPIEAKQKLDGAIGQASDAITEGRDAVQGLRDSTIQGNDLALAISTLGEQLAIDGASHRPAFRVAVEGQSRTLHPILRDEVYKIAAEAMRNAFNHAQAQQIEAEIRYDDEQFRLRVRDDGKGMDPAILSSQTAEGHFGLPGMRERAKIMGAKLTVWSEVDAGTEVELRLPANLAYTAARKSSWWSRAFAAKAKG